MGTERDIVWKENTHANAGPHARTVTHTHIPTKNTNTNTNRNKNTHTQLHINTNTSIFIDHSSILICDPPPPPFNHSNKHPLPIYSAAIYHNQTSLKLQAAHFTNVISVMINNDRWTFCIPLMYTLLHLSLQNFAYAWTARHVKEFVAISYPWITQWQNLISIVFELRWMETVFHEMSLYSRVELYVWAPYGHMSKWIH